MIYLSNDLLESLSIVHYIVLGENNTKFFKESKGNYTDSIVVFFAYLKDSKLYYYISKLSNKNKLSFFYDYICKKQFFSIKGCKQFEKIFVLLKEFSTSKAFIDFKNGWKEGFEFTSKIALQSFEFLKNIKLNEIFYRLTNINLEDIVIINLKISNFENIYFDENKKKIFFVLGSFISEDALAYSTPSEADYISSYYILTEVLYKILLKKKNIKRILFNGKKFIHSNYSFFWSLRQRDFIIYVLANCIILKILEELGMDCEKLISLLEQRGIIKIDNIKNKINLQDNLTEIVFELLRYISSKSFQESSVESKDLILNTKRIAKNSIPFFLQNGEITDRIKKIFNNNDCLIFGEQHNFTEYYTFLAELIPVLYDYGFNYIFIEEDNSKQVLFDKYINNEIDTIDCIFFASQKVLIDSIKDFNATKSENDSKIKLILYDINKEACSVEDFGLFFYEREKQLEKNLLSFLSQINNKTIILCGATHACMRNVENFSNNYLHHTFSQGIKQFYEKKQKNVFSFFSDAFRLQKSFFNYDSFFPLISVNDIRNIKKYKWSLKGRIYKKGAKTIYFIDNIMSQLQIINNLPRFYSDSDICKYTSENLIITSFDLGFDGYLFFPTFSEKYL